MKRLFYRTDGTRQVLMELVKIKFKVFCRQYCSKTVGTNNALFITSCVDYICFPNYYHVITKIINIVIIWLSN